MHKKLRRNKTNKSSASAEISDRVRITLKMPMNAQKASRY